VSSQRKLKPLEPPRSLAESAADLIREEILTGGFRQGEHLVEARIAQLLDVSRGPVREAFKLLRSEGLVKEEPRRGTFVVSLSPEDVHNVYGLRAAVEGRAARLLARTRSPAQIGELRALLGEIEEAASSRDLPALFAADLAFHDGLCRLSGNERLQEVFDRYVPTLRALLRLDERMHQDPGSAVEQHRVLTEAIEAGDPDSAAKAAEEHCDRAATEIVLRLATLDA
jgi:GntR family transcriptional regulator of gluconate operon